MTAAPHHIEVHPRKIPVLDIPGAGRGGEPLVLYELQPKQFEVYQLSPLVQPRGQHKTHIGYGGAAGGGKSYLARAMAAVVANVWPGSKGIIFRRTKDEVKANHIDRFLSEVPEYITIGEERRRLYSWNGSDLCVTWWNGSKTYFGYLKFLEDAYRYQGWDFDWMCFEEATHYLWAQVQWLIGNRLRANVPRSVPFCVYPSNPGSRGHYWYKRLFIDQIYHEGEVADEYAFVQAFVQDNHELMARDPGYLGRLERLPEPWRSWLLLGDFTAGAGLALTQLSRQVHLVDPFEPPPHWPWFGAFDWGYAHPFSFGVYCATEDGDLFKLDTISGRHLQPHEIAERITRHVDPARLRYVTAGHDAFNVITARGENTPTIAEQLQEFGLFLSKANIARVAGLNNLRAYLAWQNIGAGGVPGTPGLRLLRTEGNLRCFQQLEEAVVDPDDPEDVLKTDADEYGEGGDDMLEETRYAVASRPSRAPSMIQQQYLKAFDPVVLRAEHERKYRNPPMPAPEQGPVPGTIQPPGGFDHGEFGEYI